MNKKKGIVIGAAATTLILGFSVFQSNAAPADPKLTTDEVRELIAIEYPGEITEFELEEGNGKAVYEPEVDGDSGQVLMNKEKTITEKKLND